MQKLYLLFVGVIIYGACAFFGTQKIGLSPLVIGLVFGIILSNQPKNTVFHEKNLILFGTKTLLRSGIVFYGFTMSLGMVLDVGMKGLLIAVFIVISTLFVGYIVGRKLLKLEAKESFLISAGSAICGAAAVLIVNSFIKNNDEKKVIQAVTTVVLFGTLSMFLYPLANWVGILDMSNIDLSIYIGSTLHEVAQVVGAASFINSDIVSVSTFVKMIRVLMLIPMIAFFIILNKENDGKKNTPWFALLFLMSVSVSAFVELPDFLLNTFLFLAQVFLTSAMFCLGMNTTIEKLKQISMKVFVLGFVLWLWLIFGGYFTIFLF